MSTLSANIFAPIVDHILIQYTYQVVLEDLYES